MVQGQADPYGSHEWQRRETSNDPGQELARRRAGGRCWGLVIAISINPGELRHHWPRQQDAREPVEARDLTRRVDTVNPGPGTGVRILDSIADQLAIPRMPNLRGYHTNARIEDARGIAVR